MSKASMLLRQTTTDGQQESRVNSKAIYQYPTPLGAVPVFYDRGVRWGFLPEVSGTSTIKLLGLVFYEHDFASTFKWIT